jgi:hypothetical protein
MRTWSPNKRRENNASLYRTQVKNPDAALLVYKKAFFIHFPFKSEKITSQK